MIYKLDELLNRIIRKTFDFVGAVADLIGAAVAAIIKWAVLSALALFAMVSALLLWLSVPYFACMTMFGDDINSIWQVYAMFGIFGAWAILSKLLYDRLGKRK